MAPKTVEERAPTASLNHSSALTPSVNSSSLESSGAHPSADLSPQARRHQLDRPHLLEGRSILVAEDSDDMWRVTELFLNRAGAETERAANGKEAVEKACEHDYSAILMDMQMPVMDGLEATRRIRASGIESPILAFTTNPLGEHASASIRAGCDEHLIKPLSGQALVKKLADYCAAMDEEIRNRPSRAELPATINVDMPQEKF